MVNCQAWLSVFDVRFRLSVKRFLCIHYNYIFQVYCLNFQYRILDGQDELPFRKFEVTRADIKTHHPLQACLAEDHNCHGRCAW